MRKSINQNLQKYLRKIDFKALGAISLFCAFACWYILKLNFNIENIDDYYSYATFASISTICYGVGKTESKFKKWLLYYPVSCFFIFITAIYIINDINTELIFLNKVYVACIASPVITFIFYGYTRTSIYTRVNNK